MKKSFWKKPAALILTVAMMLSLMPASSLTAWAAPEDLKTITLDETNNQYLYIFNSGYLLTKSAVTFPTTSSTGFQSYSESYELSSSPAATTVAAFVKVMEDYTSGGGARTINLKDLHIDVKSGSDNCAFELVTGASVNLILEDDNALQSGKDRAGLQVPSGASISIGVPSGQENDYGSLNARSNGYGAGIGGGYGGDGGNITISGGIVQAYSSHSGPSRGAGIGGGGSGNGGNITISGGNVQTYSSYLGIGNGAGIGGGDNYSDGGNITISGGNVFAYSSYLSVGNGAGIGGGDSGHGGNITISGGIVQAYSSHSNEGYGAGIGGGYGSDGGNITISGGTVHAYSSYSDSGGGAGIGGGYGGDGGNIAISGGTVQAYSSCSNESYGAGIGAGIGGDGGNIIISSGNVQAYSSRSGYGNGAGIGGGRGNLSSNGGSGGNITISGGNIQAYSSYSNIGDGAGIGGGEGGISDYGSGNPGGIGGDGGNIIISGGNVQSYSSYSGKGNGAGIGGGSGGESDMGGNKGIGGSGGNVTISGGTVQAYSSHSGSGGGAGIGGGDGGGNGNGANITIAGGSILPKATSLGAISIDKNPTNGAVNVYLATITVGKLTGSSIISVAGIGSYGLKDVKTDDEGKVYFWLPTNQAITAIKTGGQIYTGIITPAATNTASAVFKMPTSTAVSKPTGTALSTSITVTSPTATTGLAIEYAVTTQASTTPGAAEWQESTVFSGLSSDTGYYIWARVKESDSYWSGPEAVSDELKTLPAAPTGNTGSSSSSTSTQPKTDEEEQKPIDLFTDIKGHWAYDDILYVVENEIMNGISSTLFAPDETMSRAMMATVLYRMEKEPSVSGMANPFDDVVKNQWYTDAVVWGANTDIVKGYSNAVFGVNDNITREQMVTILYRYAMLKGMDVSGGEDTNILSYSDAFSISEYAIPAMQWAVSEGLIKGRTDGTIDPQGTATRAEIATVLHRFNSISK